MTKCRACNGSLSHLMADLGSTPLANAYLSKADEESEESYPLEVRVCSDCFLAQVVHVVNPKDIFSDYAYFSSVSSSWLQHARSYCSKLIAQKTLSKNSLVVEIASNDGYLLKNFIEKNIPVLGIEPAENIAKVANEKGIRTESLFFTEESAATLANKYGQANLIVANNVVAHVPYIRDLLKGVSIMLAPNGTATFEFPHLLTLIKECQFDTIYHEHYSYLSLTSVDIHLRQVGLCVSDVEELPTHGGSLRLFINRIKDNVKLSLNVNKLKQREVEAGLIDGKAYEAFYQNILTIKSQLINFIKNARKSGKMIAAYGAAAKGNTLLNYCQLNQQSIEYIADLNPEKQNKLMPGNHIPIVDPIHIMKTKPDYILILPWNIKEEVMEQLQECREWGAKFIVAIPQLEVY
ncbi:methyltransferase domain-containing protein [Paraglaciecola sp.]|uniref:methyltransferase domain-containing protein n=1 Tax=Paraglaciecola sp. TaxID=1920173 RepID=UPI003EF56114